MDIERYGVVDPVRSRNARYQFIPVKARRFFTLKVDIDPQDTDPTATVLHTIEASLNKISDAIVRINISIPAALSNRLRDSDIRKKASEAYYLTVTREVHRETRLRLDRGALEGITPEEALKVYLESKYSVERVKELLEYGQKLIHELSQNERQN